MGIPFRTLAKHLSILVSQYLSTIKGDSTWTILLNSVNVIGEIQRDQNKVNEFNKISRCNSSKFDLVHKVVEITVRD